MKSLSLIYGIATMLALQTAMCAETSSATSKNDKTEQQVQELLKFVRGKHVALVTNPTGVDGKLTQIADRLTADHQTTIVAFFAPEHGLRGDRQAGADVADYVDPVTKVPVYSIYGKNKGPSDTQLAGVDTLIFDIQDVGVRFYTYMWTMTYAMESAARNKIPYVIFDRPNPIGGIKVDGAPSHADAGLVGRMWPGQKLGVATRHGLTPGEMATMVNTEWLNPKADLHVIKIPEWKRGLTFEQTGRPWVAPSPNMPSIDAAMVYPGTCVYEGTNLSEGRGTTKPFEFIGAPFVDANELAKNVNEAGLPGVRFRPVYFKPTFSKFANEQCGGVQIHVTDRETFEPVRAALQLLKTMKAMYPDKVNINAYASKLMGVDNLDQRLVKESVDDIAASWQKDLEAFKAIRQKYLLYPE